MTFPDSSVGKESACNAGDPGSIHGLERSPGEGKRLPAPVFWPREFHGLYSPWSCKESDTTQGLSHLTLNSSSASVNGEGEDRLFLVLLAFLDSTLYTSLERVRRFQTSHLLFLFFIPCRADFKISLLKGTFFPLCVFNIYLLVHK